MNDTADQPAAPGVTKEVEDAIYALQDATADEAYLESSDLAMSSAKIRAAYASLLAAIEKHVSDALAASRAENATLQAELAMATDAANKGDDARTKAGAMQDQISDLRNIIAGMFWAGGSIDDKTMGDIRALGLDCRAENAALVKLVDDLAAIEYRTFGGIGPLDGEEDAVIALIDRAQALRAGQQKGEHHG